MSDPWQDVLDTAPDAMLFVGPEGRIGMTNRQLEEMFGYGRGELVGRRVDVLVPERFRDAHKHHRQTFMADPKMRAMGAGLELWGVRKDGSELAVEISLSPVEHEVGTILSVAVRDATERRETERRLREVDRMKDEFLSVVSHELRTPLTAIGGFAQLLLAQGERIDTAGREDMLRRIARNAAEMDRLVGQLLDLSRLDGGTAEVSLHALNLADAVRTCVASLSEAVSSRLVVDVPDVRVLADEPAIDRVLSNLLTNASKFSPPGSAIDVQGQLGDGEVVLCVVDRGPGIPEALRAKVFERFFQIEPGSTGPRGGTGIGLSIVQRYVELMDGRVWIEETPGGGATFCFSVPTV